MRLPLVAVGLLALAAMALIGARTGAAADRDCSDFSSQAEAQRFYDEHGPGDPHALDADGDGLACEANPCPCAKRGGGDGRGSDDRVRTARVRAITDGDTIDVRIGGRRDTVRLIGIDTPERGKCGYDRASESLADTLRRGERVKLRRDSSQSARDSFGRLLRYVEDGPVDAGRKQILRGWARVFVFERGFARVASYRRAQRTAKRGERGIWSRCRA